MRKNRIAKKKAIWNDKIRLLKISLILNDVVEFIYDFKYKIEQEKTKKGENEPPIVKQPPIVKNCQMCGEELKGESTCKLCGFENLVEGYIKCPLCSKITKKDENNGFCQDCKDYKKKGFVAVSEDGKIAKVFNPEYFEQYLGDLKEFGFLGDNYDDNEECP